MRLWSTGVRSDSAGSCWQPMKKELSLSSRQGDVLGQGWRTRFFSLNHCWAISDFLIHSSASCLYWLDKGVLRLCCTEDRDKIN